MKQATSTVHSKNSHAFLIYLLIYPSFLFIYFLLFKSDKSSYSGNFHGGKRCGKGSMMTTDDVVHTGIWDNDCLLDEI